MSVLFIIVAVGSPLLLGHFLLQRYIHEQRRIVDATMFPCVSEKIFSTLPQGIQLCVIRDEGTFLTEYRKDEVNIELYHMQGHFFCELHRQLDTAELLLVHSFTDSGLLERYTYNMPVSKACASQAKTMSEAA